MIDSTLPIDFLVAAQTRIAAREGVPIVVTKRGDNSNGAIVLKINLLNGTARVLTQIRVEDELVWHSVSRNDPMTEPEADSYLTDQARLDPDSWLLEIEDKQGRHWFPGRVVVL